MSRITEEDILTKDSGDEYVPLYLARDIEQELADANDKLGDMSQQDYNDGYNSAHLAIQVLEV